MKFQHPYRFCRCAYTLIELMIAMTISLFLLLGVVGMFRDVGKSVNDTQSTLLMSSNLSGVGLRLRSDLSEIPASLAKKVTLYGTGREAPDSDGYLEIIEGMNAPPVLEDGPNPDGYAVHRSGLHVPSEKIFLSNDASTPSKPVPDLTVGDVDDILMFTARAKNGTHPYRGLINGQVQTSSYAEIAWFVRGNTLYRRLLLVDDGSCSNMNLASFTYQNYDLSVQYTGSNLRPNTLTDLADRRNRFARTTNANLPFPYPLYRFHPTIGTVNTEGWYYLRLPTLEETVHSNWPYAKHLPPLSVPEIVATPPTPPTWDLWEEPYYNMPDVDPMTGSLAAYTSSPRNLRAGEDIVLTNVLSFDVKVWNPYWVPCCLDSQAPGVDVSKDSWLWAPPQFVDLGQDRFWLRDKDGVNTECKVNYVQDVSANVPHELADHRANQRVGYGFTLKGRYNLNKNNKLLGNQETRLESGPELKKEHLLNSDDVNVGKYWFDPVPSPNTALPCVYDSWTDRYEKEDVRNLDLAVNATTENDHSKWTCPPPYSDEIQAIQVTMRCFDPTSKNVRQFRIVHTFK